MIFQSAFRDTTATGRDVRAAAAAGETRRPPLVKQPCVREVEKSRKKPAGLARARVRKERKARTRVYRRWYTKREEHLRARDGDGGLFSPREIEIKID